MRKKTITVMSILFLLLAGAGLVFSGGGQETKETKTVGPVTLNLISHRFPMLEFYAEELGKSGIPEVKVEANLMPRDKAAELLRIALSAGGVSPYQIAWADQVLLSEYASKGWVEPLDDYIKKYKDVYHFDDIPNAIWDVVRYEGKIYGIPLSQNIMHFFYRKDIFAKYSLQPPKTFDEWFAAAKKVNGMETPYGTNLTLGRVDGLRNDFHGFLMGYGGEWFDSKNYPLFNGPQGIKAVTMIKEMMKYAPPEVLTYFNDQAMVAFQQGMVAMGNQWATRAAAMDDPKMSKVVGLIDFAPAPSGTVGGVPCSKLSPDIYIMLKNINVDKDLVFRVMAEATDEESMVKAAQFAFVPRKSVASRSDLVAKYRYWPAALATIVAGARPDPIKPWFTEVDDIVTLRIAQALSGEMEIKEALNLAAKEVTDLLKGGGYLK